MEVNYEQFLIIVRIFSRYIVQTEKMFGYFLAKKFVKGTRMLICYPQPVDNPVDY